MQWTRTLPIYEKKLRWQFRNKMWLSSYSFTSAIDTILNEFRCDIKVSRNIGARMISHGKAHVANIWHVSVVAMTCINLAIPWTLRRIQNMRNAHQSQKSFIFCGSAASFFFKEMEKCKKNSMSSHLHISNVQWRKHFITVYIVESTFTSPKCW